jgi:hypothetical protein
MGLNEKPRRAAGLDGLAGWSLGLGCASSVSESYLAVLAKSNTPTRSPSTWAKSVGSGAGAIPVGVSHDLGLLKSPRRVGKTAYGQNRGLFSLQMLWGLGGSSPGSEQ